MFFTILFIAVIFVGLVVALPYFSGLTTLEVDKKTRQQQKNLEKKQQQQQQHQQQSYGYVPPDEQRRLEEEQKQAHSLKARASAFKDKINVTSEDIPIKIKLNSLNNPTSTLRNRHKEKLDIDNDPNNYDYDLDELIEEETNQAKVDQETEFYKHETIGKDKEEMV
ncbi:hypothetical protein DFJ63DRAFT_312900 [Scheffersomyces coipomensis]|uniref:uncharacterized protein n=1 Tax=Scheffersomyces coipomensis TaxID=1788519 RepID=UPI00315C74AB